MELRKTFKYSLGYSTESYECSLVKDVDLDNIENGDKSLILDAELKTLTLTVKLSVIEDLIASDLISKESDDADSVKEYNRLLGSLKSDFLQLRGILSDKDKKIKEVFLDYSGLDDINYIRSRVMKLLKA